jgi:hypothetical protein
VFPSNHVTESQAVIISVLDVELLMVRFKVTTESQPAVLVKVKIGVLVLVEYVFPSIQVIESQVVTISVLEFEFMVKFKVMTESQPTALVKIKVGVLVLVV